MAYMCIIASVPSDRVAEIRLPADVSRVASRVAWASHYIAPVCPEIQQAMDGGTPMETDTWHPLRGFIVHQPASVHQHALRLAAVASEMSAPAHPLYGDSFVRAEFAKVVDLFRHASSLGDSVVTSLDLTRTGKKQK
jgi:hypothetical protein